MNKTFSWIVGLIVVVVIIVVALFYLHTPSTSTATTTTTGDSNLTESYQSPSGFSIDYPAGYTVNPSYQYQELGPGNEINGVSFTIPASMATGTNLSSDSYLSVEQLPQATSCTADLFLGQGVTAQTVTDDNTTYSFASSTGAGAGNRYDEIVYAIPGSNPCTAVRYFIHYGAIDNYPAGSVQQFDEQGLIADFDAIRRSLTLGQ